MDESQEPVDAPLEPTDVNDAVTPEIAEPVVWLASESGEFGQVGDAAQGDPGGLAPEMSDSVEDAYSEFDEAEVPAVQYRDPLVAALVTTALSLVVVLLATTLGLYVYLSNLNHAPRTRGERDVAKAEMVSKTRPKDVKSWVELSYAYMTSERYDDALAAVAKGSKLPKSEELDLARADILRSSGRHEEALKAYDKALKSADRALELKKNEFAKMNVIMDPLDVLHVRVYFGRASSKQALGDIDGAITDLEKAVEQRPTEAGIWFELGKLYEKQGDKDLAEKAYGSTLKYIPDDALAQEALQRLKKGK